MISLHLSLRICSIHRESARRCFRSRDSLDFILRSADSISFDNNLTTRSCCAKELPEGSIKPAVVTTATLLGLFLSGGYRSRDLALSLSLSRRWAREARTRVRSGTWHRARISLKLSAWPYSPATSILDLDNAISSRDIPRIDASLAYPPCLRETNDGHVPRETKTDYDWRSYVQCVFIWSILSRRIFSCRCV